MMSKRFSRFLLLGACCIAVSFLGCAQAAPKRTYSPRLDHRWLFIFRDLSDPKQVDRTIALFPRAQKDGYNGIVFSSELAPAKAAEFRAAAKQYGLKLIVSVMNGSRNRNNAEGLQVKDALFVAHNGVATFQPDNPTKLLNGGFEEVKGEVFSGWDLQDDPGVTTFADHAVVHSGKTSLRMQEIVQNKYKLCRVAQPIVLQPYRQYHLSAWVKTENMHPATPELKVLIKNSTEGLGFQTFTTQPTQEWRKCDVVFNSLGNTEARLYFGLWGGEHGKLWVDDLAIEEIGLVNVLRRPGTPVSVKGEDGAVYQEGADYVRIVDPQLNPWHAYHDLPAIKLTPDSRIPDGACLRVGYYNPAVIYGDRVTMCLSEPAIFEEWREQVKRVNELVHPDGFFMSHDELRVMNQCALCQSRKMTPGQILADNVHKSAAIIRAIRPDAEIWVWNDMFDPMHNAVPSGFYLVNGPLTDSWKGLDKDVGIMNWHGGLEGKNGPFFASLGLRQMLSGYYDGDEDGAAIARWLANTKNVKGVVGAMYTTWEDKYGAMDAWAQKAWGK